MLGIPGTNGPDPRESGMPPMYISGYSDLGNNEGWNPAVPQRPVVHVQHQRELDEEARTTSGSASTSSIT